MKNQTPPDRKTTGGDRERSIRRFRKKPKETGVLADSAERVFLDANVLFSVAWRAKSELRRLWRLPRVALISSPYAVEEARRNLNDAEKVGRLEELLPGIDRVPEGSADIPIPKTIPEKDQPIIRAAIQANAVCLLTGDKRHFGRFFGKKIAEVRILLPRAYLNEHPPE